jgi:hypothetical protein
MAATQAAYRFPTATPTAADFVLIAQGMKRRLATPAALAAIMAATVLASAGIAGVKTLAATGNQALTVADLGKLILMPNTGALTLTLPAAASCANGRLTFKKTSADAAAVTIDGNASETIDGSANFAACDAANDTVTMVCDGTAWYIVAKIIA